MEQVILVDAEDNPIGVCEKMEAHQKALLHRAFSVFIFNTKGEMLIHQRALTKYHSGGLWTNACCGHPRPNETTPEAATRRLMEEMLISTQLKYQFYFTYKAELDNNLTEFEIDHVFFGEYNQDPGFNAEEIMNFKWISLPDLISQVNQNPNEFTAWFKICLEKVLDFRKDSTN